MAHALAARVGAAEIEIERASRCVASDDGGVDLEGAGLRAPILRADVGHVRTGTEPEIVHAAGEAGRSRVAALEVVHDRHLRHFVGDDERVREARAALAVKPVEGLNWQRDLDAARDVEERAGA